MIYYFTSTGNCAYVAQRIADATEDTCAPINEVTEISLKAGEALGFVFPTYFWALPYYVEMLMRGLYIISEDKEPYVFFVSTYGTTPGAARQIMQKHMNSKGYPLAATFGVKMPDDWTPWFDLSDLVRVAAINNEAEPLIETIATAVKYRQSGDYMQGTKPTWMTFFSLKMYERYRKTKYFTVADSCIGCGKCEAECPEHAIEIRADKPAWVKGKCTLCLHCLHTCPQFAIQYGDKTKHHGQYYHTPPTQK